MSSESMPSSIGSHYTLHEKLGAGGMGTVFKAHDASKNRTVAIKIVTGQGLDRERLDRFEREIKATSILTHPHIVSVLDQGQESQDLFLVMEFIDGLSLKEFIQSQPDRRCDLQTALRLGIQIAQALHHAHAQGVLHRDIKPENIMITRDGEAKLMDFGLAKIVNTTVLTRTGTILGTPAYMPPEQPLGKGSDERSDLYSLGCVLYEMVTGQHPFPNDNPAQIIFSHINDMPRLPRQVAGAIPPELEELLLKSMAKDPDERYQTADEMLQALASVEPIDDSRSADRPISDRRWAQAMVGRDDELSFLKKHMDNALRGESRLVFLTGEAGIGKTRLVHELGIYARLRGAQSFTGRGQRGEASSPYRPWVEILRAIVNQSLPDPLSEWAGDYAPDLAKLVPELGKKLGNLQEVWNGQPADQRERLFDGVTQFVVNFSKQSPLILFLEDLQWADDGTLQLLGHCARSALSMGDAQILTIGAFRELTFEGDGSLPQVIADLNRERLYEALALERLNAEEVSKLIQQTFGHNVSSTLESLVYQKTDGNPFFVEEVLRALLDKGAVVIGEGGWQTKDASTIQLPESVHAVVQEQLDRLPEEVHDILSQAAVIGREFNFTVLQELTNMDEDSLIDVIEVALQARLLLEQRVLGSEVYAFADRPVREVLYQRISPVRRRRQHKLVGEALEKVFANKLDEHFGTLALHFLEANDVPKTIEYGIKAGDQAFQLYAWEEAERHYTTALELLDNTQLSQRAYVLTQLGWTKFNLNDPDASLDYHELALETYKQLEDKHKLFEKHMDIQALFVSGVWDGSKEVDALHHIQAATTLIEDDPDSVEKGLLYQRSAHIYLHKGDPAQALEWSQKAVELFARISVPMGTSLGTAQTYVGHIDEGMAYNEGNWKAVVKAGNLLVTAILGHEIALLYALARDIPSARAWGERVLPNLVSTGPVFSGYVRRPLTLTYALSGEVDKAKEFSHKQEENQRQTLAGCYFEDAAGIGIYYLRRGDWDEARAYLEETITGQEQRGNRGAVGACAYTLGILSLAKENHTEAEEHLLRSLEICQEGGNVIFELWVLPALAELYLKMNQIDRAVAYVKQGVDLMTPNRKWYGLPGPLHMVEGMLATHHEKWKEAEEAFAKSVAINRQYELPWDEAKALYEWGIMLARKGDASDANHKLDEALTLFQKVEAKKDIMKLEASKNALGI